MSEYNLLLVREPTLLEVVTFGDLYELSNYPYAEAARFWLCHTMEDAVREIEGKPPSEWKVPHLTAIPFGRYQLGLVDSPKFGPDTITLLNVPGWADVRMHKGNTPEDTDGCVLVGMHRTGTRIYDCALALDLVKSKVVPLLRGGSTAFITIARHA